MLNKMFKLLMAVTILVSATAMAQNPKKFFLMLPLTAKRLAGLF